MNRFLTLVALLVLTISSAAQTPSPAKIQELNQKAVAALSGKKYDEGIALLKELLVLRPKDKGTAYNLACAHSLKGEVDAGFEWLEKASEWGWGSGTGQIYGQTKSISEIEMCRQDADLANLQKDPRFEPLMTKMQTNIEKRKTLQKTADAYAAAPAVYVPEAVKALPEMPLLVVVHDQGTTKDQVVSGFWKGVADELGYALVVPSGKTMIGEDPSAGMAWFESATTYMDPKESWKSEKPIHDAVAAFKKDNKVDASRIVLVGEGQMGALVAFGAGLSSPGLYKVVIGVDGLFAPQVIAPKTASAAKMGQKAAVLWDSRLAGSSEDESKQVDAAKAAANKTLSEAGIGSLTTYTSDEKDPAARKKAIVDLVRSLATGAAAKPVEAGTPK